MNTQEGWRLVRVGVFVGLSLIVLVVVSAASVGLTAQA